MHFSFLSWPFHLQRSVLQHCLKHCVLSNVCVKTHFHHGWWRHPNIHPARCFNPRVFFSAYANRTSITQSDVISRKRKATFSESSCISSTWQPHLHGNEGSVFCIVFLSGSLISLEAFSVSSSCLASSSPWKRFLYRLPVWHLHLLGSVFCIVFLSGSLISMETKEALSVSSSCSSSAWQPPCSVASFSRGGQGRASHAATSADPSSRSTAPPSSPMRFSASLSHLKDNHNTLINSRAGQNTFDFHPENKTFTRPRRVRRDSRQWNATRVKQEAKCGRRRLPKDG